MSIKLFTRIASVLAALLFSFAAHAWTPMPVSRDPLVRMPGTQPAQGVTLEGAGRCLNCHAGYNPQVEPGFNWQGSMMAQSARDPFFWASVAVAAQDSIAAIGRPNATDICLRCHLPKGWLEGRSDPTNATAMQREDFDGVQCDFCHRNYDAHHVDTDAGTREGADWAGYWDETNASGTKSSAGAAATLTADKNEAASVLLFDGRRLFGADGKPVEWKYVESGGGQYFVAGGSQKRASFADATGRHQQLYSRFHKSRYFCASCHDVSNPVLANLMLDKNAAGSLPTEHLPAYAYFHVERTFSEFMLSAYGVGAGAEGIGPFAPDVFKTSKPGNKIAACQDCHMRDVSGRGANKNDAILRPTDSIEHPKSGQPLHDLTGGNTLVPRILASTVSSSPNYDPVNAGLLNRAAELTMDLGGGLGLNPAALLAGADRAQQQLELAATIQGLIYDPATGALSFRIQNQTGHKLISGYPEGRRIWINIRTYGTGGALLQEVNPWDGAASTLKGLGYVYADPYASDGVALPEPAALGTQERHEDALVYEVKMASSLTGEETTFHFALADGRYKDNRIPPKGFRITDATARMAEPVWNKVAAPGLFTAEEYAGGYHNVSLVVPKNAVSVEVRLFYQGVSREYVEFLRDEIDGRGKTLDAYPDAYIAGTDPFFNRLRAWGPTIWRLWKYNRALPGAAPVQMAFASTGGAVGCVAPAPVLNTAEAGHQQVALAWSDVHSGDAGVTGYRVYRDQSGKAQLLAEKGLVTGHLDTGLTNGQLYCYTITSVKAACESAYSNVLCATPKSNVQLTVKAVSLDTGRLVTTGKGGNKVTTFEPAASFKQGETVAVRARMLDAADQPLSGASFTASVSGPSTASIGSGSADAQGYSLATWSTSAPSKNKLGTPTGTYKATVTGVSAGGYTWDGVALEVNFQLTN
jgi:hypothetical protein